MKVTVIASVSANGKVLVSDNPNHQIPQEVTGFFFQKAIAAGNIVFGYSTYSLFSGMLKDALAGVEVIVLSNNHQAGEYKTAGSPEEAIAYLKEKGMEDVIVCGGTQTYNAFLEKDLVTDIYLNIAPFIVGDGGTLGITNDLFVPFNQLKSEIVAENIVRLHLSR